MGATCAQCERETTVLVVLDSPVGEFGLCPGCYAEPDIATLKKKTTTKAPGQRKGHVDDQDPLLKLKEDDG